MPPPGYVPKRVWWKDLLLRVAGNPNVLKRLQYADIMRGIGVRPGEVALDFGCGSGYITYDLARRGAIAHGLDVAIVDDNVVPPSLEGRLFFHRASGQATPFADATFDVVLMSEVVPMIADPRQFFTEVSRILRKDGRIVLVNPLERRGVRRDYEEARWPVRFMRALKRAPKDYDEYTRRLQESFGTAFKMLPPQQYYESLLRDQGFRVTQVAFTPGAAAQETFERAQFLALCMGWPTIGAGYFLLYPVLAFLDRLKPLPRGTGCIMVATRQPA